MILSFNLGYTPNLDAAVVQCYMSAEQCPIEMPLPQACCFGQLWSGHDGPTIISHVNLWI